MKRLISVLAAASTLLAVSAATTAPAEADTVTSKTITRTYSTTKTFYSAPLKRCIRANVSGSMSAFYVRSIKTYPTRSDYQSLQDPKLGKPRVAITTTATCAGGSARATVTKATLRQSFYYWKCSGNPSISVSYPWSVGLSITPSCGEEKVAQRTTTYDTTNSAYTQNNTGVRASWDKLSYGKTSTTVSSCLRGVADVTIYRANRSDSAKFDLGNICISV